MSYTQLNQVLQAGAQPVIEIAMGKRGAAGPAGVDGVAGATGPAGAAGAEGPRGGTGGAAPGGLDTVIQGGSQDARNHHQLDAQITVAGGVATFLVEEAPLVHDLALVSFGKSNPSASAIDNVRRTGRVTRVGSQTFTMAVPGVANGSGTTTLRFLDHYAPASYIRHMRDALNGAINIVANVAQGGERTNDAINRYQEVAQFNPRAIIGSLNEGNDVDNLTDPAGSLTRLRTMISYYTDTLSCIAQNYGPPCVPLLDAAHMRVGKDLIEGLIRIRKGNPRFRYVDTFGWTVLPNTGQGDPLLFATPTDIHFNQDSAYTLGLLLAADMVDFTNVLPDPLVQSVFDYVGADASSLQICPGWWTAGAIDASTLSGRATGTAHEGITAVQISGTANVAFSTPARDDGFGFSQKMVFSGLAGDAFAFDYVGPANAMASKLQLGYMYDPGHTIKITQSAPGTLGDWESYVGANLAYASGNVNARLSSWMRLSVYANPARQGDIPDSPALYPPFLAPSTATGVNAVRFAQGFTLAEDGTVTIEIGRPTMRRQNTI